MTYLVLSHEGGDERVQFYFVYVAVAATECLSRREPRGA